MIDHKLKFKWQIHFQIFTLGLRKICKENDKLNMFYMTTYFCFILNHLLSLFSVKLS